MSQLKNVAETVGYPEEFKAIFEPDYMTMFEHIVIAPLKTFIQINKWPDYNPSQEELVDLFNL